MKSLLLFVAVVVVIFALVPTSEAVCANQAVYDECMRRGNTQLSSCAFDDWGCKCTAHQAIHLCYLQCPDDQDIQNLAKSHETETSQACTLASSQASAKQATATGPVNSASPPPAQPPITPPPTVSSPTSSSAAAAAASESSVGKSSANTNKINAMIAAVPFIIIGQFI